MHETSLSDLDFHRLSRLIETTWGIRMPYNKKLMLEGRLSKRLKYLGMPSLETYCQYLFSPEGHQNELIHVIDVVSTNKTDFFRDPAAFSHMMQYALPELVAGMGAGIKERLMIWSAGCSTGEEPYTLAMFLSEFASRFPGLGLDYMILATDVSVSALETAKRAIFSHDRIKPVPIEYRQKYLLISKIKSRDQVRIKPALREKVRFRQMNLMDEFGMREAMDIIFCRNVVIYFDRPTQARLFHRFCRQLKTGGYLYVGHSEYLTGMELPLRQESHAIFRKVE